MATTETDVKPEQHPAWVLFREGLAAVLILALSGGFVWAALYLTHQVWPLVPQVDYWGGLYLAISLRLLRMATVGGERPRSSPRRKS